MAEREAFERASDPPSTEDLEFAGLRARETGAWEEAESIYTELMARKPDDPFVFAYRAEAKEALGKIGEAEVDYRVAAGLRPEDVLNHYSLGRLLTESGQEDEGARQYSRALEVDPENAHLYEALADNALRRGRTAVSEGDLDTARELFEQAERFARRSLAIQDDLPVAHLNLGVSLMEQNRAVDGFDPAKVDEALGHYEWARQAPAGNEDEADTVLVASVNLCDALIQLGRAVQALAVCQWVVERRPRDPVAHYNLAGAYALAGKDVDALAALERDFELGDRDHEYLVTDEWFSALRTDPRFRDLVRRMKTE